MTRSPRRSDQWADRWGRLAHRPIPFAPVVDGDVLPVTPWQALADGAGRDVDLLVGHTRDEHRLFSRDRRAARPGDARSRPRPPCRSSRPARTAHAATATPSRRRARSELYELVHSDWLFRMPTLHLAEAQTAAGGRAHVYELTWPAPGMGGVLGACHGLDVPLVFGNLSSGQPAMLIGEPPVRGGRGAVGPDARRMDGVRHRRRPRLARVRHRATPRAALRHRTVVTAYPEETSRLIWQDHTFSALPLLDR